MTTTAQTLAAIFACSLATGCSGTVFSGGADGTSPNDAATTTTQRSTDAGSDVPADAGSEVSTDGQSCTALQTAARSQYDGVVNAASYACSTNADCVEANPNCFGCCGGPYANATSAATINSTSSQLCEQLTNEGCGLVAEVCPCAFLPAWTCVAGTCTSGLGNADAGTDAPADAPTCDSVQSAGRSAVVAALQANQSCAVDADCVSADTGCFLMCQQITNTAGAAAVTSVANNYCAQLTDLSCPAMTAPPCFYNPDPIACLAGTCGTAPVDQ